MRSCVTCTHCNTEFTPLGGAAVDDCPVCGRSVETQPTPAPLPAMYTRCPKCGGAEFPANAGCSCDYNAQKDLQARVLELEKQITASKRNERRWIAKGEEAIAERNAANKAIEAIKRHQEIVAGTGTAQMSMTWKIADDYLRSRGAALAATEVDHD